jgi:thiamine biosynthesis protein ThiS
VVFVILVNNRPSEWQDGLTVKKLLEIKKFTYPRITVIINGNVIMPENYDVTPINDGDDVQAIHLMAGG